MSLTAAICNFYDANATLQYLLGGEDKMWVSKAPTLDTVDIAVAMPYITLTEISDVELTRGKDLSYYVSRAIVQYNVWTTDKTQCDAIVEALEDAYMAATLVITSRSQMSGHPTKRNRIIMDDPDSQDVWHGVLELEWLLEKTMS